MTEYNEGVSDIIYKIHSVKDIRALEDIWDECANRMGDLKRRKTIKLKHLLHVGDEVQLSSRMQPKYISNARGPITKIEGNTAGIQMPDEPQFRRFRGTVCIVPLSAISKRIRKASG